MNCTVEGCERVATVKSRGLCMMHYKRWRKHGDPTIVEHAALHKEVAA